MFMIIFFKALKCRLQGTPSPAEAPPIGQIHPFSKRAVTFEQLKGFDALQDLESF